eukprot:g6668.t1
MVEGGSAREYVLHRIGQLFCNSVVAFFACFVWVFLLCASPYVAGGLCFDLGCGPWLPKAMISAANMAATGGRLVGLKAGTKPWLPALVLESLMLLCLGLFVLFACMGAHLPAVSLPTAVARGLTISAGLTGWSNFLLMRNDHSAQQSCGHSILLPCHVSTEIMWLSIQVGSIAGTSFAASL